MLNRYARVAIGGGPRVGKTTLAALATDRPVVHTDDWRGLPWSDQPYAIIEACSTHERFDPGQINLIDGRHRLEAAQATGARRIRADILPVTRPDATNPHLRD